MLAGRRRVPDYRAYGPMAQEGLTALIALILFAMPDVGRYGPLTGDRVEVALVFVVLAALAFALRRIQKRGGGSPWWTCWLLGCTSACVGAWASLTAHGDAGVDVNEEIWMGIVGALFIPAIYVVGAVLARTQRETS